MKNLMKFSIFLFLFLLFGCSSKESKSDDLIQQTASQGNFEAENKVMLENMGYKIRRKSTSV